jgi:RNA polymerase sigma factor (sigma-70 family)
MIYSLVPPSETIMNAESHSHPFSPAAYGCLLALVLRLVRDRSTAEDVLQAALLAVLGNEAFDPTRGLAALAFIRRKVRWSVRDHYRRRAKALAPLPAGLADWRASEPHQALERAEVQEQVRHGIGGLPEVQREVMVRHLAGMNHDQIAAELGVPIQVVYRRFHAGKGNLRRLLGT